jgi:selenocysteine-specific elongation factor
VTPKNFIVATAGHVDHGKSALIQALTGTDPDRLPEEKARGITIDLGFAELNLTGPDEQRFDVGIVDVPGHEDFVRNMIAGIGSIDLALLVVAADDGWMPQTEEHLQILTYLGVQRAVIAVTKSDLNNADNAASQIRDRLRGSPFANSQIVATSARTGEGIENLKLALASEFATLAPPREIGKPRLFVDRVFTLHGIGTVVTGTLTGGRLRRGQAVVVQPQNLPARIRSVQNHGRDIELAMPGMRTAVNLPDVALGTGSGTIKRGDVITVADLGSPSATLDVLLEKSARLNPARPLKNGSSAYVHHGTTRVAAKVVLAREDTIGCGESAIAQLRLESPIFALFGDRFVIRDASEQHTIAGGTVLHPDGDRESFRSPAQTEFLDARAKASGDVAACLQSELLRYGLVRSTALLLKSNFSGDEIAAALFRLQNAGVIVQRGKIVADAKKWRALRQQAIALVDDAHNKRPEQRGLKLVDLRGALPGRSEDVIEALISDLCENGFARSGTAIARTSHRATLPAQIQPAAERIRSALSAKPFDPPGRKEFAKDPDLRQALRFLIEQGEVVEVSAEIILLRASAEQMREIIVARISKHGPATASELRQKLETSRRIIIPFLEYLDRLGVTLRAGDRRGLRATPVALHAVTDKREAAP